MKTRPVVNGRVFHMCKIATYPRDLMPDSLVLIPDTRICLKRKIYSCGFGLLDDFCFHHVQVFIPHQRFDRVYSCFLIVLIHRDVSANYL